MNRSFITEGLMIGRTPYGNTSVITRWITPDHGRVNAIAKGALRPKNALTGQFDLYYHCELKLSVPRTRSLHTLTECRVLEAHTGLRQEYARVLCAHYFTRLIETITEAETPLPEDYALLKKSLEYLSGHAPSRQVLERFEQRLLVSHGWANETKFGPNSILEVFRQHHWKVPVQRQALLRMFAAPPLRA